MTRTAKDSKDTKDSRDKRIPDLVPSFMSSCLHVLGVLVVPFVLAGDGFASPDIADGPVPPGGGSVEARRRRCRSMIDRHHHGVNVTAWDNGFLPGVAGFSPPAPIRVNFS